MLVSSTPLTANQSTTRRSRTWRGPSAAMTFAVAFAVVAGRCEPSEGVRLLLDHAPRLRPQQQAHDPGQRAAPLDAERQSGLPVVGGDLVGGARAHPERGGRPGEPGAG